MPSSIGSKVPQLIVGAAAISALGLSTLDTIRSNNPTQAIQRAATFTGDQFILTTEDSTPSVHLNDETTAVKTYPTTPGVEQCEGNTGALLCTVTIKLTGSGGHRNHNAGSYTCGTATCSIVSARVSIESGSDVLYGGWTTSPGSASGAQLVNHVSPNIPRGGSIIGSGAYTYNTGGATNGAKSVEKDVPPGATIKFVWKNGNSTEDYSRTKAAALIQFWKFWTP